MARIDLAKNRKWSGIFEGEFFGNLFLTKNIDLEKSKGKVVLGENYSAVFDSADDADLITPVAFVRTAADTTDRYWVNAGKLFKTTNTDPETGWTQDAIANSPSAPLYDLLDFAGGLYVPIDNNIDRLVAGTWTNNWWSGLAGASALQTGKPHRLAIFSGAMLITDGRFINTFDGTLALDPAIILPIQFQAQWIRTTADFAYIGTKTLGGSEAEIFFWDRTSAVFNSRYGIGDSEALCGFTVAGIPHVVTKKGEIKRFTGQGFRTVQQFPTVELGKTINNIDPNGVVVDEDIVKINVDFGVLTDMRLLSGIWTFDTATNNLYHGGSIRNDSGLDYSQQEVAAAGAMLATLPTQGRYLVGGKAYTAYSGSTKFGIFTSDEGSTTGARGYIITPKITAQNVQRFWREFIVKFKKFLNSTDRIRVAYRTQESTTLLPLYETVTWVTTTTFKSATVPVAAVGDFVEILGGDNAGALAKITAVSGLSAGFYTYTIDLTLNASTSTARVRFLNFTDLGTVSSQAIQNEVFRVARRDSWIQYIVELRGKTNSPELEDIMQDYDELRR